MCEQRDGEGPAGIRICWREGGSRRQDELGTGRWEEDSQLRETKSKACADTWDFSPEPAAGKASEPQPVGAQRLPCRDKRGEEECARSERSHGASAAVRGIQMGSRFLFVIVFKATGLNIKAAQTRRCSAGSKPIPMHNPPGRDLRAGGPP